MSPRRRSVVPLPGLLVGALIPLLGCLEAPPRSEFDEPEAPPGTEAAVAAPARYLTHFVFAGVDGTAFFARFQQSTDEASLTRAYDAWWSGPDGWQTLAAVRDTLPVPRAAWRILPADGLDVRVGDSREIAGLTFSSGAETVELLAGEEVVMLSGPTGQRESVGLAALSIDDQAVGGLLFFRRAARALQFADDPSTSRGFLLADSVGNGLLIETSAGDSTAIAHTWMHGTVEAWDDVVLIADTLAGPNARRWTFEIPGAALSGAIRAIASPATGPVPALRIEGDLVADGDVFRFNGVVAPLPLP